MIRSLAAVAMTLLVMGAAASPAQACFTNQGVSTGTEAGWVLRNNCNQPVRYSYCIATGVRSQPVLVGTGFVNPGNMVRAIRDLPPGGRVRDSDFNSCFGAHCAPNTAHCNWN